MTRGSEWRRWDLHIHTPFTKLNDQFKIEKKERIEIVEKLKKEKEDISESEIDDKLNEEKWKKFCELLNESEVECFGITDYFSVENYINLVENREKYNLNSNVVLFPNVETRVTGLVGKGKNKSSFVNVHLIFDNQISNNVLNKFIREINIKNEKSIKLNYLDDIDSLVSKDGFKHIPSINDIENSLINTFGSDYHKKVIIMIPNGYDGLENNECTNISSNHKFKKNMVDIIQTTNTKDINFHLGKNCLDTFNKQYPCVSGSDSHSYLDLEQYPKEKSTWIKADKTFEGLKSIIFEPKFRVKIQETNPSIKVDSKVIDSIEFFDDKIGPKKLYFNEDLNSIIGGRSSGKSLLLSILANKTLNIKEVKGDNESYNNMIKDFSNNTKIYDKKGNEITSMIVEFFYQDKLQEISRNQVKINEFILNTIGKQERVEKEESNINSKVSKLIELKSEYINKLNKLDQLIHEDSKIQDLSILNENIESIKEKISKIDLKFSDEEIVKINEKNSEKEKIEKLIEENKNKLSILESSKDKEFASIKLNNYTDLNTLFPDELSEIIVELDLLNSKFRDIINKLNEKLLIIQSKLEGALKKLLNDDLFKRYLDGIKNSPELDKLNLSLETEKENLKLKVKLQENLKKYKKECSDYVDKILALIKEILQYTEIEILNRKGIKINYSSKINIKKICEVFSNNIKTSQLVYKSFALGEFKEIALLSERNTNIIEIKDFFDTVKNILSSTKNEHYKVGMSKETFLEDILKFEFLVFDYDIFYNNLEFIKMSEGKKSLVLLLIKLELGEEDCPILIDQPEDNLDNKSIIEDIVDYFKEEKNKRQIFIVTHNANIVISCDSENVIIANEHDIKNKNPNNIKYYYKNGSLENKEIKENVCEILEGGITAFKNRESRYYNVI